ncbi:TerC family protein [Salininema proteolyticum]|uniref:TerC family protein n=1 Tax=Salininema proteolyticum TaxID=1607685 RepID=A0ABV8U1K3_9ACTN
MNLPLWAWVATIGVFTAVIVADIVYSIRNPHRPSFKESAVWSLVYFVAAIAFTGVIFALEGMTYSGEFLAGYLTEKALSVDNLFVFLLILTAFKVPDKFQSRVLMTGIVISIVLRGAFIAAGAALIAQFSWVFFIFGAILIWTAIQMINTKDDGEEDWEPNRMTVFLKKHLRVSDDYDGGKLFTRINGLRYATPMLLVIVAVGSTDILFALDSIPAIFGLTKEPYIVFTATVFALLGLRQLYFLLAGLLQKLRYLDLGLSIILVWIGVKLILTGLHDNHLSWINDGQPVPVFVIPTWLSLGFIVAVLGTVIAANHVIIKRQGKTWSELMRESEDELHHDETEPDPQKAN